MADEFRVSSGIKMPGRMIKYHFAMMEIGDSFPVKREELRKVRAAASAYGKAHNMKFSIRMINPSTKTYRCWRIKKEEEEK